MCRQVLIKVRHDHQRVGVVDRPQSGNDCLRAGQEKGPGQRRNPLFALYRPDTRIASRQDHQIGVQVELNDLRGLQETVFAHRGIAHKNQG